MGVGCFAGQPFNANLTILYPLLIMLIFEIQARLEDTMKRLKLLFILFVIGLLAGCAQAAAKPSVATLPSDVYDEIKPSAKAFVDAWADARTADAAQYFAPSLVTPELEAGLKKNWIGLVGTIGAYQKQTGARGEVVDGRQAIIVTCQFEKDAIDITVFFNPEKQITGAFFSQAKKGS